MGEAWPGWLLSSSRRREIRRERVYMMVLTTQKGRWWGESFWKAEWKDGYSMMCAGRIIPPLLAQAREPRTGFPNWDIKGSASVFMIFIFESRYHYG